MWGALSPMLGVLDLRSSTAGRFAGSGTNLADGAASGLDLTRKAYVPEEAVLMV